MERASPANEVSIPGSLKEDEKLFNWLQNGESRCLVLAGMRQPSTAKHMEKRTGINGKKCSAALRELHKKDIVQCLNPEAKENRIYWLTDTGLEHQEHLRATKGLPKLNHEYPIVDWNLYGWACYRHRASVLKGLAVPMQPATIKKRALLRDPTLRMSANNVRDIMPLMLQRGIVKRSKPRKKAHWRYELTDAGKSLRVLLMQVEMI